MNNEILDLIKLLDHSVSISDGQVKVLDSQKLRKTIHRLAEVSALESGSRQGTARYLTRLIALAMGVYPASIHELYMARGRSEVPFSFTVPAINLRAMTYVAAQSVFKAALTIDASAMIFEIARSEMGYTDQRPAEYSTSILAAAIAENYQGPVFIQGDHFQVSAKKYTASPDVEIQALKELILESIQAGFYNIDIDTSTMVDLSKKSIPEQQELNSNLSAMFTSFLRLHQPTDVIISVGGEIGEVGGHNSTEPELCAYMDCYLAELTQQSPGARGISKISIQTGTSHGGVVLPDGSIAKVNVDFDTLKQLSRVARKSYGLGGAVQHGASTLPEDAFSKFVESEALEVHLATNFQNMLFDRMPANLRSEMYAYLSEKNASEQKPGMTDEQFYYKVRKNVIGPFKRQVWNMPPANKDEIAQAWQEQFSKLFNSLGLAGTRKLVEQTTKPVYVKPSIKYYLGDSANIGDVSDLAD